MPLGDDLDSRLRAAARCRLRHASLLDAAHITPDHDPRSVPAVSDDLALCKIHRAVLNENILGVRPDMVIEVRTDILQAIDGPMLRHGLQEMHGLPLTLPRKRADRPSGDALEERYERFRRWLTPSLPNTMCRTTSAAHITMLGRDHGVSRATRLPLSGRGRRRARGLGSGPPEASAASWTCSPKAGEAP